MLINDSPLLDCAYYTPNHSPTVFLGRAARDRVSRSMLGKFPLPLPPLSEQAAIAEYLGKATADIDSAIARARRQIDLVQEYRTRLIADVVTGKLDVREAVAELPDEGNGESGQ